ncbi:hypothetical protein MtrunA17_Chr2g0282751 [Medicago truncatula]|uniref:Uncharacterized protein n=1 Tax=Medicago truncatula TaxID=3880 RepID=A0A396J6A2_MEDTR|nr:hypothetical protein MtrunA17_Chr2g0282751 [Medicago truncatula]
MNWYVIKKKTEKVMPSKYQMNGYIHRVFPFYRLSRKNRNNEFD